MEQIKQNLQNLARIRPDLAAAVSIPLPPHLELQTGKTNLPTLLYQNRLFHSRYDPLREAQVFADSLSGDWDHLVLMGMGLGYHILPLLDHKKPKQRILVYEPDPAIFSASLHLIDWGRLLSCRDDLFLVVGNDSRKFDDEVHRFFSLIDYEKLQIAYFPPEKSLFSQIFQQTEKVIDSLIRTLFYDFKTRLAEGGMVSQNILRSLPKILETRPLRYLRNRFHGKPGVIVSAGPSLDDNIILLQRVKNRAMIIAVDTALKPLLANDIQPHFTVTADPSHKNYRHLLGTEKKIQHFLLAESAVSSKVFQDFQSRIFTVSIGKPLLSFCEKATGPIGELDAWGSVISLALSFAVYLGLTPLTFIGQDFAYTHLRNHCRHSSWEESLVLENPSLESLQRFERQSISGQMVGTSDIFGRSVYTSDRLALYKDYLVRMLNTYRDQLIFNSSEGGILKEIPFLPFEEFMRRYLTGLNAIKIDELSELPALGSPRIISELHRLFSGQLRFFQKYQHKLERMLQQLTQAEFPSATLVDQAQELKQSLYHHVEHGNLVEMWSQFPIYNFLHGQKKLPANSTDPVYTQQAVNLYKTYFRLLKDQLTTMIRSFENTIDELNGDYIINQR